jgi:hypothetical protein
MNNMSRDKFDFDEFSLFCFAMNDLTKDNYVKQNTNYNGRECDYTGKWKPDFSQLGGRVEDYGIKK